MSNISKNRLSYKLNVEVELNIYKPNNTIQYFKLPNSTVLLKPKSKIYIMIKAYWKRSTNDNIPHSMNHRLNNHNIEISKNIHE